MKRTEVRWVGLAQDEKDRWTIDFDWDNHMALYETRESARCRGYRVARCVVTYDDGTRPRRQSKKGKHK